MVNKKGGYFEMVEVITKSKRYIFSLSIQIFTQHIEKRKFSP